MYSVLPVQLKILRTIVILQHGSQSGSDSFNLASWWILAARVVACQTKEQHQHQYQHQHRDRNQHGALLLGRSQDQQDDSIHASWTASKKARSATANPQNKCDVLECGATMELLLLVRNTSHVARNVQRLAANGHTNHAPHTTYSVPRTVVLGTYGVLRPDNLFSVYGVEDAVENAMPPI